ncbi:MULTISPECIES: NUDIX hydrolase [Micromonospora]|uniref:NUDIX domain-containing protein n=1 Tax=Micromonospora solifontis TaxID=2487138 RepID=A0ABX9WBL0_9ACTN|nr:MULTISPECIES: NUDIX domain-containing protein [Micromonospora]NES12704.1 NUDIX domain-containing protein [Micromonospora sp. PPF5-17B]NES39749.1 NUDIX domain-containing protein [Micromonospora solifontis]NES54411.1 NUDIX domain-containing protein [Micromonospora sp. PPF5-6]RNL86308.1 NUDIX domain-containing protein [Micromonospora solifontis]
MEQRRRIGAYGVLRDSGGRVLLARGASRGPYPGVWQLPGGGVEHAEHPAETVVRKFAEETGLAVAVTAVRAAVADVAVFRAEDAAVHTDRLVFDVDARGGEPRPEPADGSDELAWFTPAEAAAVPLMPFTAELLGLPVSPLPADLPRALPADRAAPAVDRRQRFAAYGLVTDPAERVLLTMIADGYPGAGKWHLPGGGTDHGEQPAAGLLRELVEEAGQLGRVVELLAVDNLHNPAALGPEGRPLDWHGVRVIYRVRVDAPTEAVVTELAGGSTARAAWFAPEQVGALRMTDVAALATGRRGR